MQKTLKKQVKRKRLIAMAAPELLAALKRLLEITQGAADSEAAAQDQAMEAIEKAEGK